MLQTNEKKMHTCKKVTENDKLVKKLTNQGRKVTKNYELMKKVTQSDNLV